MRVKTLSMVCWDSRKSTKKCYVINERTLMTVNSILAAMHFTPKSDTANCRHSLVMQRNRSPTRWTHSQTENPPRGEAPNTRDVYHPATPPADWPGVLCLFAAFPLVAFRIDETGAKHQNTAALSRNSRIAHLCSSESHSSVSNGDGRSVPGCQSKPSGVVVRYGGILFASLRGNRLKLPQL